MKRIILIITILCSSTFSLDWQNDYKEIGTHGKNKAEWTKLITIPVGCDSGLESRLDQIVLVSTNILNKKPSEWLNGRYLEYVNKECTIWRSLRGTEKDFKSVVDYSLNNEYKPAKRNEAFPLVMLLVIIITFALIRSYAWERRA